MRQPTKIHKRSDWIISGDIATTTSIRKGKQHTITIDAEDLEGVGLANWGISGTGTVINFSREYGVFRQSLASLILGPVARKKRYLNGNRLDCRRDNLVDRSVTYVPIKKPQEWVIDLETKVASTVVGCVKAYVSAEDVPLVQRYYWYVGSGGYLLVRIHGRVFRMHRMILPTPPPGLEIDHANTVRTDNTRGNLRLVTRIQNAANAKISKANTTGVKYVSWCAPRKRWRSSVTSEGVQHNTYHRNIWDAAQAGDLISQELSGEYARFEINYAKAALAENRHGGAVVGTAPNPDARPGRVFRYVGDGPLVEVLSDGSERVCERCSATVRDYGGDI